MYYIRALVFTLAARPGIWYDNYRKEQVVTRTTVALLLCLAFVFSADAQLVYVKCCFPNDDVRIFGPAMTGPGGDRRLFSIVSGTCIYGFGPDIKSIDLQAEMCDGYILPDMSDSHCTWWRDLSVDIVDLCWRWGGRGNYFYIIYDYDGDGDLDLRDFARFQNTFGQETQG